MVDDLELRILEILNESVNDFITSDQIGKRLGVSGRTVRNYINNIKSLVEQNGGKLISKRGSGYKLVKENEYKFNEYLYKLKNIKDSFKIPNDLQSQEDRELYVIQELFFGDGYVSMLKLSDELAIGWDSVINVIKPLRNRLDPYGLRLVRKGDKASDVYCLQGSEIDKRKFISSDFFAEISSRELDSYITSLFEEQGIDVTIVHKVVIQELKLSKVRIVMNDYLIRNLVMHVCLLISRVFAGNIIDTEVSEELLDVDWLLLARSICKKLEIEFEIDIPEEEVKLLAINIGSKGSSEKPDIDLREDIINALKGISAEADVTMCDDDALIDGLQMHISPLLIRLNYDVQISNPLLDKIESNYSYELYLTRKYLGAMSVFKNKEISDEEWGLIALHVIAGLERAKKRTVLKVAIVCSSGLGSAQVLKSQLEATFSNFIEVVIVTSYYDAPSLIDNEVDLIITTVSLDNLFLPLPQIQVNPILSQDDKDKIGKFLKTGKSKKEKIMSTGIGRQRATEIFDYYIKESSFKVVKGRKANKQKIIESMIDSLKESSRVGFKEKLLQELLLRESYGPIVYADVLAFPHPSKPIAEAGEIAITIFPDGLSWDSKHDSIKLVFLMSPSKIYNKGLDSVSRTLARIAEDQLAVTRLTQVESFSEFRSVFVDYLKEDIVP